MNQQSNFAETGGIATCPCGTSQVRIDRMPRVRFFCHCTICQKIYPGDYADATLMLADHVEVLTPETLSFAQHKAPPALDRGVCNSCKHPVVGFLAGPMGKRLAFLPTKVLPKDRPLPEPKRHVFYATRVRNVDDGVPKTHGETLSMLALTPSFLGVLLGR